MTTKSPLANLVCRAITKIKSYGCSKLDAVLEGPHEVRVGELDHVQVVGLLHVLDPLVRLTLGVNHQRPPTGVPETQSAHTNRIIFLFFIYKIIAQNYDCKTSTI